MNYYLFPLADFGFHVAPGGSGKGGKPSEYPL